VTNIATPHTSHIAPNQKLPSIDLRREMISRAVAIAPRLRERAQKAASDRKIPIETIEDFHDTGLLRLAQPRRFGGFELGWDILCEISQILAQADGSQAWIHRILADHAQMISTFPSEAQDEVWGVDTRALISASFDPNGRAKRVSGGFMFSGRHKFSSGIDFAQWLICGGFIEDGDKLDGPHFFLVPKSKVTVVDDWDTIGLEGTGSKSFEVSNVFLPEHRFLDGEKARCGEGPGTLVNKAPVYRTPRGGVTSTGFAALSVGMAKSVLDEWLSFTGARRSRADQTGNWAVAARASTEIDAAEALYFGTISRSMRILEAGGTLDDFDLLTARRNVAFSCKLAIKGGSRLFSAAGAHAIFNHQRLSQQYRNLLASGAHFAVSWDVHGSAYGRKLLDRAQSKAPVGAH
jgi:3-hydroxy-9,10-secoandrosta-1,3,5(10)-triene-9,17-dione monooxygenase